LLRSAVAFAVILADNVLLTDNLLPMSLVRKLKCVHVLLLFTAYAAQLTTRAQILVIDQGLLPPSTIGVHHFDESLCSIIPPTGQEFIPAFNGLDFVDVNLFSGRSTQPGAFQIAIHDGTITGSTLGLSAPAIRTNAAPDHTAHFTFEKTIVLTPGAIYVLEIIQTAGDSGWAVELPNTAVINGTNANLSYAGGRLINSGAPQATNDLGFREGIYARLNFRCTPTNTIAVSWPAQLTGAVLQQTDSLNNTNWSGVNCTLSTDGTNNTAIVPQAAACSFFRLRTTP
jgi:hypothetical protein